ncbi:phosphinothricin N-acetyltransferase [Pseudomonas sp. M47T1]|uniref:GNAT family N-acetyltransferase n=1 Tax=unclassified Pseudomonas TaxID=196821 RepID=UPI000260833C|nr:GNAT family N-acetyltransferase [Pseudomonas sp. M47T1]EIK93953.1 phosphinothricin N-acetyltransferase [Pseudomonas sp. M47T1]
MPLASHLRDATADDMATVQAIYADHVLHGTASFELTPPTVAQMQERWGAVREAGLPYQVLEVDGEVVGYGYATLYRPRPAYRFTCENSVYLKSGMGGQGLGALLLAEVIARCEQGGWRQMVAVVGDSANVASLKLHERLGFRRVGVLESVGFKHGRWLDTVLMQRSLGQGDGTLPI